MTTAKTISIIPAAAIKIPKMRMSFFLKEKRFFIFGLCFWLAGGGGGLFYERIQKNIRYERIARL